MAAPEHIRVNYPGLAYHGRIGRVIRRIPAAEVHDGLLGDYVEFAVEGFPVPFGLPARHCIAVTVAAAEAA